MYNKPQLISFHRADLPLSDNNFITTTTFVVSEPIVGKYIANYKYKHLPCDSFANILKRVINDFVMGEGRQYSIGGPLTILKMTPTGYKFLQNDFSKKNYSTSKKLISLIKQGKIKLFPVVENGRKLAIQSLEKK